MSNKINQVRGAVRYNKLKRFGPALSDFSGLNSQGKVFWASNQIGTSAGQYCDLRSAFSLQWASTVGINTLARYNIDDSSNGGPFAYAPPDTNKWPKKNTALRLPHVVRFIILLRNTKYFDYKSAFDDAKSTLENDPVYSKRIYIVDADKPISTNVPFDIQSYRFMAAFCPIANLIPPDESDTSETKFLGTDVLNIVILNPYDIFWYGPTALSGKAYLKTLTEPGVSGVDLSYAAWIKHNMDDVIRYKRAFKKYRKITTWVYTDETLPSSESIGLTDPRPYELYRDPDITVIPYHKETRGLYKQRCSVAIPGPMSDCPELDPTCAYTGLDTIIDVPPPSIINGNLVYLGTPTGIVSHYYIGDIGPLITITSTTNPCPGVCLDDCLGPSETSVTFGYQKVPNLYPVINVESDFLGQNVTAISNFCNDLAAYNIVFKGQAPSSFTGDIRNYFFP